MALFPIHNYFIYNNETKPVSDFVPSENEGGIYEVVRIVNKVPLFLEEHLDRFYSSAKIAGKAISFSPKQVDLLLKLLIEKNEVNEGNVLISCKRNLKAFYISHQYPDIHQYSEGVKCGILKAGRENPNAKIFQTSVRQQADKLIDSNGFYEVLLVDNFGKITEGSRSNVFFIKGDLLITPPAKEVLLGITRQKTFLCAEKIGLPVFEEEVFFEELNTFDAAFVTGTSPKILPINQIENLLLEPNNNILQSLIYNYNLLVEEYVKNRLKQ